MERQDAVEIPASVINCLSEVAATNDYEPVIVLIQGVIDTYHNTGSLPVADVINLMHALHQGFIATLEAVACVPDGLEIFQKTPNSLTDCYKHQCISEKRHLSYNPTLFP